MYILILQTSIKRVERQKLTPSWNPAEIAANCAARGRPTLSPAYIRRLNRICGSPSRHSYFIKRRVMPPGLGPSECRAGDNNWERLPLLESCWNERSKKMRHASRNRWLQAFVKWILISRSWTRLFCSQKDTLCEYGEVISVDYQVYIICSWTNGWKRFVVNYCAVDGVDNFTSELWTLMFANCSSVGDFRNCFDRTSVSMLSLTHELPCVYRSESLRWEKSNLSTTLFSLFYVILYV